MYIIFTSRSWDASGDVTNLSIRAFDVFKFGSLVKSPAAGI